MTHIDYKKELNPEQYQAVTTIEGPVLIIAGAGSGKTRVITFRLAYMLEQGITQSSLLALTFTNKAAQEMHERITELTKRKLRDLTVSTFHSFGAQILRKEISKLGYRENFSIYDEGDRLQLIKDCARELKYPLDKFDAYAVGSLFSNIRSGMSTWENSNDAYRDVYDEYRRSLKIFNAVDFDDLIALPLELFAEHPDIQAHYKQKYKYIMIDEFQDTSSQQYAFMRALAHENICVVGDDDQSIYSWRGANYKNLQQFEIDFPQRVEIKLERNYRSTSIILEAANAIIANNGNRKEKNLYTPSNSVTASPILLISEEDEAAEAEFIAETIKTLRFQEAFNYADFGILIRTNSLASLIEEALLAANIPYRVAGGSSFFARKEIKDIISYLRVIANPDDDVNLLRIINTPRRGIGKTTIEKLGRICHQKRISLRTAMELERENIVVQHSAPLEFSLSNEADKQRHESIADFALQEISDFLDLIEKLRGEILGKRNLSTKVRSLIDELDYWSFLIEENKHNDKIAKWKFHNLEIFLKMIERWENDPDNLDPSLFNWLNRISLITQDNNDAANDESKVSLTTIHAAKGLEFLVVFIAACEDGIMPHARSIEEGEANLEEERRLFYVAVTRARKKLFISSAQKRKRSHNTVQDMIPSPFIAEIPPRLIQNYELEQKEFSSEDTQIFFDKINAIFKKDEDGTKEDSNDLKQSPQSESIQSVTIQNESAQNESMHNESAQNESMQNESTQNESTQNESTQNESTQNESIQNEIIQNESTRNDNAESLVFEFREEKP